MAWGLLALAVVLFLAATLSDRRGFIARGLFSTAHLDTAVGAVGLLLFLLLALSVLL